MGIFRPDGRAAGHRLLSRLRIRPLIAGSVSFGEQVSVQLHKLSLSFPSSRFSGVIVRRIALWAVIETEKLGSRRGQHIAVSVCAALPPHNAAQNDKGQLEFPHAALRRSSSATRSNRMSEK